MHMSHVGMDMCTQAHMARPQGWRVGRRAEFRVFLVRLPTQATPQHSERSEV